MKFIKFFCIFSLFMLMSCSPKGSIKDGYYLAFGENIEDTNWTEFITIEVKDGIVQDVNWDAINFDYNGTLRDAVFHEGTVAGIDSEIIENIDDISLLLEEKLIGNYDSLKNEIYTSVESFNVFMDLVNKALKAGPVKPGIYKDGVYTVASEPDDNGFYSLVTLVIRGGNVIGGSWNQFNGEGVSKRDLARTGVYDMGGLYTWDVQADLCVKKLVKLQRPERFFLNEEGKTDVISGVSIAVSPFSVIAEQILSSALVPADN